MKYSIQFLMIFFALTMTISSCVEEGDYVVYPEENLTRNDILEKVLINTPAVSFIAGDPGYDIEFIVITPDNDKVTNVNVYKTFSDVKTGAVSDEVLQATYDVPAGQNTTLIQDNYTYEELRAGIVINGGGLPDDEVEIAVGSKWSFRVEPVDASGTQVFSAPGFIIAVQSPFAGIYTVIESAYVRIGVPSGDWNGEQRFIGSVDATTFAHEGYFGAFAANNADDALLFTLNDDLTITVHDDPSQLIAAGNDMLTCQEDPGQFQNVDCAGSNVLIPMPDGKHIIKLTYGYFTTGSGAREFYEVLEKNL